jgi:hypothetical protein
VDKVYNAKNIFWITTLYRKIGRKITFDFENFEVNSISNGVLVFNLTLVSQSTDQGLNKTKGKKNSFVHIKKKS